MPKVKKLPKWAIRQAGGINKKAWALARRGKTSSQRTRKGPKPRKTPRRQSTPRAVGGASHTNSKPGWGRWFKTGRTIDIFSGPAQGSVAGLGFTRDAAMDAGRRYVGPVVEGGDIENVKTTAGSIGTGLLRDWIRSKIGVYRGVGQKKALSIVMAANPEIMATGNVSPLDNLEAWNRRRMGYDRGYNPESHRWAINPQDSLGADFWQSIGLDAGLKVTQKVAEVYINPLLPPGYNL